MKSNYRNNIYLSDVMKMRRKPAFMTMIKPVGANCNLNCTYCYYRDKAEIYASSQMLMSDRILELYIKQYLETVELPVVTFCWHGGEPLLAGIDFFRKAIALQKRYARDKRIENTIQTNGVLINDEWCRFFSEHGFLVGISLDGPKYIHDTYRRDCGKLPTFDKVMKAIELMKMYNVDYNILATVNAASEGYGCEVYVFLREISSFIQFLPVVEYVRYREEEGKSPLIVSPDEKQAKPVGWSVSAQGFGQFLCDVFDKWIVADVGRCFVQLFDITLANWCGVPPSLCAFCETCGDGLTIEHNGDVYSCDHFVYPEYCLGNIEHSSLEDMYNSEEHRRFSRDKREALPIECKECIYNFLCRGECPKHRFKLAYNGERYMNVLCEGYKMFFRHSELYMKYMKKLLQNGRSPIEVMDFVCQHKNII